MADNTLIEWTDATWNPITGCKIVSPGCTNCYAMKLAGTRLKHVDSRAGLTIDTKGGPVWNGQTRFNEAELLKPLRWKRPRRIFVCAHGDLFAESVPDEWIDRVFAVMALSPQHTFQVLTKRAARMKAYCSTLLDETEQDTARRFAAVWPKPALVPADGLMIPLPNVWLGVSAEDQTRADERIPDLLATPAAIRFVSAEPLLGSIDFTAIPLEGIALGGRRISVGDFNVEMWNAYEGGRSDFVPVRSALGGDIENHFNWGALDWIIVGGESGQGARPMHPDWPRQIRDQCASAGVAFFFKQWGTWLPMGANPAQGWWHNETKQHQQADLPTSKFLGSFCALGNEGELIRLHGPAETKMVGDNHLPCLRVGKKHAGRLLDGIEHSAMPEARP